MIIRDLTAPNPGPFTLSGTRTYLLGNSAVLDPGPAIDSHVDAILAAMPGLRTILITHRHEDHAPAAVAIRNATGARIVAPRGVLDDAIVDQRVTGGERIEIENELLEVIATPGHTREHVCYLTQDGDLFTGDTVLGEGTTTIFPPDGSMGDYMASLRKLLTRAPKRIFPGHGPSNDDARSLIETYIAHRLEREQQVLQCVADGVTTARSIRDLLYPHLDPRLHGAAEIQIDAHLEKLREEGRVEEREGGEYHVGKGVAAPAQKL